MYSRAAAVVFIGALLLTAAGCGEMRPPGQKRYLIKHTVQKGDTLYSIAWRYGQDHRHVAAWNHIEAPYEIYPGEEILIIPPNRYSGPRERPGPPMAVSRAAPRQATPPAPRQRTQPARQEAKPEPPKTSTAPVSRARTKKSPPAETGSVKVKWGWPTQGRVAARYSPKSGKKGVDISGEAGQSIRAAAPGTVVYSGDGLIGYGNLLIIKHDNTYLSAYGHNKKLLVKEGDTVEKGQEIARMGQSPKSGSILYFEIRRGGKPVDPLRYLPSRRL